jgi:hypothetical protein
MSSGAAVVCWVALLLWLAAPPALPFNLETRLPLVKYGADGVYFGFSVAEHQTVNYITNASAIGDSWSVFFYLFLSFLCCLLFLFCCVSITRGMPRPRRQMQIIERARSSLSSLRSVISHT